MKCDFTKTFDPFCSGLAFRTGKIWEHFRHEPKKRGVVTSRAKKLDSRIFMQVL